MKYILGILLSLCGLLTVCHGRPDTKENCTEIGVALSCCTTGGCVFVNCTDEDRCEFYSEEGNWGDTCVTATNQCEDIMTLNTTTNGSAVEDPDNSTSTAEPVTQYTSDVENGTVWTTQEPQNHTDPDNSTSIEPTTNDNTSTISPTTDHVTTDHVTTDHVTTPLPETSSSSNTTGTDEPLVTTEAPYTAHPVTNASQPQPSPAPCQRHFDTASFIGGIVFLAGIAAIGAFIYMYYRSRQDVNYRML